MVGELLLEAFPLTWPERQPRSAKRRSAAFKVTLARARDALLHELGLLGASGVIISSNVPVRRDGLPYADAREPADPGVAVYFERRSGPYVIACDAYNRVQFNIRAVGVTVEALRAIQRHGATEMLEQAFTGFAALPPHVAVEPWWTTLGLPREASLDDVRRRFRELATMHHPDRGGDVKTMSDCTRAYHAALNDRAAVA